MIDLIISQWHSLSWLNRAHCAYAGSILCGVALIGSLTMNIGGPLLGMSLMALMFCSLCACGHSLTHNEK
ncbi:hypothetical protein HQ487_05040 [Candidatus Uhrbacteria bacterium]|nr:hypothetical protein [Candidatus Uhrbacteria bacterium]